MKRINLTIVITILLMLSFSVTSLASSDYSNPVNLFDSDPSYFDLTDEEKNNTDISDLFCVGKICVEYTHVNGRRVRSYVSVYSSYEHFGAYMYQEEGSSGTILDYLVYDYKIGDKLYVKVGADLNSNEFIKLTRFYSSLYSSKNGLIFHSYTYSGSSVVANLSTNCVDIQIISTEFPIFSNQEDYLTYRETGIINNALYDPTVHYSGDDLYFKEFKVTPHVSNQGSKFYFEIYYELSDFALDNIDVLNIRFDNQYDMDVDGLSGLLDSLGCDNAATNTISLSNYKNGFKLYLSDIRSIEKVCASNIFPGQTSEYLLKRVLGNEIYIDLSGLTIGGVGGEGIYKIVGSHLYCQFYLRASIDGKLYQGKRNDFNYDFLNKSYDVDVWTTNDDSSLNGNFDYTKEGETITSNEYYYNDVTTNDDGTTVNNYYYYDKNGNRKEITEDVYNNSSASIGDININVDGNGSGEYININPVDFNQFVKGMKNMLEEFDTKGGLFLLIKDVFSMYPSDVTVIIVGAISTITIVSIICILRR